MSDLSRVLGLDSNKTALSAINATGQTLFLNAAQGALDHNQLPINLAQFVRAVPAAGGPLPTTANLSPATLSPEDWAQRIKGMKVVLHALIEGVSIDGKTAQQFISDVETRLDAWVDSSE